MLRAANIGDAMHAFLLVGTALAAPPPAAKNWAVIFDAGSTGTRCFVYSFTQHGASALPEVRSEPTWNTKVTPGISSFANHPDDAGGSLAPLLHFASKIVPAAAQPSALVMLKATAGMRMVKADARERIYTSLLAAFRSQRGSRFVARREDFGTLAGEDEGLFGWLSTNQLLVAAGELTAARLGEVGALDLGGGSAQITFAGGDAGVAVRLPGQGERRVFTHSHLGFGNKQVLAKLTDAEAAACLAAGANASSAGQKRWEAGPPDPSSMLVGRGAFAPCLAGVRRVLTFDRHGQPDVSGRRFVAMSLFHYAAHFAQLAGHLRADPAALYSARDLRAGAAALCAEPAALLHRRMAGVDPDTPDGAIQWRCFDLTYISALLDAYGFDHQAKSIRVAGARRRRRRVDARRAEAHGGGGGGASAVRRAAESHARAAARRPAEPRAQLHLRRRARRRRGRPPRTAAVPTGGHTGEPALCEPFYSIRVACRARP